MNKLFVLSIVTAGVVGCGGGCHWPFGSAVNGRIEVSPVIVCPGSTLTVSWDARGSNIAVNGPDGTLLSSSATGSASVTAPSSPGAFQLTVDGESVPANFQVQNGPTTRPVVVPTGCGQLPSGLYAVQGQAEAASADSRIRVVGLRVPNRSYAEVMRGGVTASVANGLTTVVPPAETWTGTYTVTSLLENNETCASPPADPNLRTAPSALEVDALTECR